MKRGYWIYLSHIRPSHKWFRTTKTTILIFLRQNCHSRSMSPYSIRCLHSLKRRHLLRFFGESGRRTKGIARFSKNFLITNKQLPSKDLEAVMDHTLLVEWMGVPIPSVSSCSKANLWNVKNVTFQSMAQLRVARLRVNQQHFTILSKITWEKTYMCLLNRYTISIRQRMIRLQNPIHLNLK